jgi:hypothetical protein
VLAGPLPDVLGGYPDPAVAIRLRDHRLEQPSVRLLDLTAAPKLRLGLAEPHGEPVADPLELGDAEDARPSDRRDAPLDPRPRKRGREQLAEALLEQRDLAAQLLPGLALGLRTGHLGARQRIGTRDRPLERVDGFDVEQFLGHEGPSFRPRWASTV